MLQRQGIAALPGFPGLFRGDLGTQAYKLAGEEAQEHSQPRGGGSCPTRWNFRHRLSRVSSWLCRPMLGLYTVKYSPRFCSARRQLVLLPRT